MKKTGKKNDQATTSDISSLINAYKDQGAILCFGCAYIIFTYMRPLFVTWWYYDILCQRFLCQWHFIPIPASYADLRLPYVD